jgi:hypothetical protein
MQRGQRFDRSTKDAAVKSRNSKTTRESVLEDQCDELTSLAQASGERLPSVHKFTKLEDEAKHKSRNICLQCPMFAP